MQADVNRSLERAIKATEEATAKMVRVNKLLEEYRRPAQTGKADKDKTK